MGLSFFRFKALVSKAYFIGEAKSSNAVFGMSEANSSSTAGGPPSLVCGLGHLEGKRFSIVFLHSRFRFATRRRRQNQ